MTIAHYTAQVMSDESKCWTYAPFQSLGNRSLAGDWFGTHYTWI